MNLNKISGLGKKGSRKKNRNRKDKIFTSIAGYKLCK